MNAAVAFVFLIFVLAAVAFERWPRLPVALWQGFVSQP